MAAVAGSGNGGLLVSNATINGNIGVGNTAGTPASTSSPRSTARSTSRPRITASSPTVLLVAYHHRRGQLRRRRRDVGPQLRQRPQLPARRANPGRPSPSTAPRPSMPPPASSMRTGHRVFTVTSFNTTSNNVLTIDGDTAGDKVVLNFTRNVSFNNQVVLSGISPDQVLYNFVGGSNFFGGPAVQINNSAFALAFEPHSRATSWTRTARSPGRAIAGSPAGSSAAGVRASRSVGGVTITTRHAIVTFSASYPGLQYDRHADLQRRRDGERPGGGARGRHGHRGRRRERRQGIGPIPAPH